MRHAHRTPPAGGAYSRRFTDYAGIFFDDYAPDSAWLRERATLIDKSFRAGETPLPELLRALNTAAQAESAVARQTAALGLARARLQQSLGILP